MVTLTFRTLPVICYLDLSPVYLLESDFVCYVKDSVGRESVGECSFLANRFECPSRPHNAWITHLSLILLLSHIYRMGIEWRQR